MEKHLPETILRMIPSATLNEWDRWDYRIVSPASVDDEPFVYVFLKNKDGSNIQIKLPMGRASSVLILPKEEES